MKLDLFETLFKLNYEKVYKAVTKILKDDAIIADAVQEGFYRGLKNIDQLQIILRKI